MVRYSFVVGLLPPQLSAGLSRRFRTASIISGFADRRCGLGPHGGPLVKTYALYFARKQNNTPSRDPIKSRFPAIAGDAATSPPSVNFQSSLPSFRLRAYKFPS